MGLTIPCTLLQLRQCLVSLKYVDSVGRGVTQRRNVSKTLKALTSNQDNLNSHKKTAVNAIILVSSTTKPQLLIEQGGRKLGEINVLLDSGADISIMNDTLASRIGLQRSEVTDISRSQVTTATNQVIEISGEGTATIVLNEDTRVTTRGGHVCKCERGYLV